MRHLSLTFFGGFHAALNGEPVTDFGSDKTRALLAYLVLETNRPHRRSALADMFWPDLPEKKAAHNFSQTLLRLRRALKENGEEKKPPGDHPFLRITVQDIQLNPLCSCQSDASKFYRLMQACDQHHPGDTEKWANCPDCIQWLREAVDLYAGELLNGFFVNSSIMFEEWRLVRQEALRMQVAKACERLTTYYERRCDYDGLLHYAQRLTVLDPWCEGAHLQVMRAMMAKGQTAAALFHYQEYKRTLANDLGVLPSQDAANLYQHIRAGGMMEPSETAKPTGSLGPHLPAERRQITALVCGRRDSPPGADPEEQYEQMLRCRRQCEQILGRFGGFLSQRQGKDCLVYYGYPQAYEDSASRAVSAGLAMAASDLKDPVQVGVHSSLMVIGEMKGRRLQDCEMVGEAPNYARACKQMAEPGTVVISSATRRLVEGLFETQRLKPHESTGSGKKSVFQVFARSGLGNSVEGLAAGSSLNAFVGRDNEMEQLDACLRLVKRGQGHLVLLRGEPGIGKTRLLQEWKKRLLINAENQPLPIWLEAKCSPYYQSMVLYPLIRLFEQLPGLTEKVISPDTRDYFGKSPEYELPEDMALAWLQSEQRVFSSDPNGSQPRVFTTRQRERLLLGIHHLITKQVSERPLILVIEDLHWSDSETIQWLDEVFGTMPRPTCLTLLTRRPMNDNSWRPKDNLTILDLKPFNAEEIEAMAHNMLGKNDSTRGLREAAAARSDGIPLYLQELLRACAPSAEKEYGLTQGSKDAGPPETLLDLLTSWLDALGPARMTAQWAAILGRSFPFSLLQAVSRFDPLRLENDLNTLVANEILSPLNPPRDGFVFRRALLQEAAYASLLKSTRKESHRRVVETLERNFPEILQSQPEWAAYQRAQAGLPVAVAASG